MNLLYWNLKSNKNEEYIALLIKEHSIDIAIFSVLLRIHCYQTLISFIKDMVAVKKW